MKNSFYKYFIIFSAFFYISVIVFGVFQIKSENNRNTDNGRVIFNRLKNDAASSYSAGIDFSSKQYKDKIKYYFTENLNLEGLTFADNNNVIQYLYVKNRKLLADEPDIIKDLKYPVFNLNPFLYSVFSDSIIIAGNDNLKIEMVYRIISYEKIADIIKYLIIFILIYIIFSVIMLLFVQDKKKIRIKAGIVPRESEIKTEPLLNKAAASAASAEAENSEYPAEEDSDLFDNSYPDRSDNFKFSETFSFNPQSGLVWYEYFSKRLAYELEKAGSFDNDLTLSIISYSPEKIRENEITKNITSLISTIFMSELAFEYKQKNSFAVIIPDTQIEDGIAKINAFIVRLKQLSGLKNIHAGLSSKNSRIISGKIIIKEAEGALEKSLSEPASPVVAFRSDPDKYRQTLSEKIIN